MCFLEMNIPLKHRINSTDFKFLAESGKEFIYILSRKFLSMADSTVINVKDYTHHICI